VGEGGDEVSVARFIADQRTFYRVPYAVCCVILGVSQSWFYKWLNRPATPGQRRRADLDAEVLKMFNTSKRTYGSPRVHADLLAAGWTVGVNTVADSMRRLGLQGRKPMHSMGLTRQDRKAPKFPDLLKRDFTAPGPNLTWCGDITEIPTDEGKLYMATVLDLFSRRLLAAPTSEHPNAQLAADAIKIAAAGRGGRTKIESVIFNTDRGPTYTASSLRCCVRTNSGSGSRWGGSVRVSTTRLPNRSFRPSSTKFYPGTTSPPRPKRALWSWPGATSSTTPGGGTARRR